MDLPAAASVCWTACTAGGALGSTSRWAITPPMRRRGGGTLGALGPLARPSLIVLQVCIADLLHQVCSVRQLVPGGAVLALRNDQALLPGYWVAQPLAAPPAHVAGELNQQGATGQLQVDPHCVVIAALAAALTAAVWCAASGGARVTVAAAAAAARREVRHALVVAGAQYQRCSCCRLLLRLTSIAAAVAAGFCCAPQESGPLLPPLAQLLIREPLGACLRCCSKCQAASWPGCHKRRRAGTAGRGVRAAAPGCRHCPGLGGERGRGERKRHGVRS